MLIGCPVPGIDFSAIHNLIEMITGSSVAIEVAPEQLIAASDSIKTKISCVSGQLSDMQETMSVVASYWEGNKHDNRFSTFKISVNKIEEMIVVMNKYSERLQKIAQNYINTEDRNEDAAGELPVNVIS